jgi:SseB protein C-terminal domain
VAHGLEKTLRDDLIAQIKAVPGVRRAYLVQKIAPPDDPLLVLGLRSTGLLQLHNVSRAAQIVKAIQERVKFPRDAVIIKVDGNNYRFARKMRRVEDSMLI